MCDNTNPSTQSIADYLAQLLKDRKQLAAFPNVFMHMERLLDEGMYNLYSLVDYCSNVGNMSAARVYRCFLSPARL